MNNMKPLLFHIGYHKTATTWMQKRLFQPEHGFSPVADHSDVFTHLVKPHGLVFDPALMRGFIEGRLDGTGLVPVVSSEILSGHPFFAGRESDIFARRIKDVAPDAKILISIRDQLRILPSVYAQYIQRGGTMKPERFFAGTDEPGYWGFDPCHFEYDRLVRLYQQLFGAENVLVVTQEALKVDMDAVAREIAEFANAPFQGLSAQARQVQSPSYPEYTMPWLRRCNHFQRSTLNDEPVVTLGRYTKGLMKLVGFVLKQKPARQLLQRQKPVSTVVEKRFKSHFASSNRRLAALIGDRADILARYDGMAD